MSIFSDAQVTPDAVKKLFSDSKFPDEPLVVNLLRFFAEVRVVDDKVHAPVQLVGTAHDLAGRLPCSALIRGYVVSEVNAGNPDPLVFVATADRLGMPSNKSKAQVTKEEEKYRVPAAKVPGGKAHEFFSGMAHCLSNQELAGKSASSFQTANNFHNLADWHTKEDSVSKFLEHDRAIKTLHQSPNHEQYPHYISALQEFQASQLDRQTATLTSNTGRETASTASQIETQHKAALLAALNDVDKSLTPELLCQWHGILTKDTCRHAGKLRPKNVNVKVGHTSFRPAQYVQNDVKTLCQALATWEARLLQHNNRLEVSPGLAAVTFAAAVFFGIVDTHAFADGNGRLARIAMNWALHKAGIPFCIHLFATQAQRKEYRSATVQTRRNVYLQPLGDVPQDALVEAFKNAGALLPLVDLILDRLCKAITEFEKLVAEKSSRVSEQKEVQAARSFRDRVMQESCLICFDERPNIATLCCLKAVHLNCMAQWLSTKNSCPNCRAEMPALPERMRRNEVEEDDATTSEGDVMTTSEDETTEDDDTEEVEASDTTLEEEEDSTVSVQGRAIMARIQQVSAGEDSTADDTTEEDNNNNNDDTTMDESSNDDTTDDTTLASNPRPDLPPFCSRHGCTNRSARDCDNGQCGRCCVAWGEFTCSRHS